MSNTTRCQVAFFAPVPRGREREYKNHIENKTNELRAWVDANAKNACRIHCIPAANITVSPMHGIIHAYEIRFRSKIDHTLFKLFYGDFIIPTKKGSYSILLRKHDRRTKGKAMVASKTVRIKDLKKIAQDKGIAYYRRGRTFYCTTLHHAAVMRQHNDFLELES